MSIHLPPAPPTRFRTDPGPPPAFRDSRDWQRRWRRLRLPDLLHACARQLDQAATEDAVLETVALHAARIVGAFTCLLFVRRAGSDALWARPDPRLRAATDLLRLPRLRRRRPVRQAETAGGARFAALAPLFSRDRAVVLACSPFPGVGALALVERRRGRDFGAGDWALLSLVAALGRAALERLRAEAAVEALHSVDPLSGLPGRGRLGAALELAWERVEEGHPLSLALLSLEEVRSVGPANDAGARPWLLRAAAEAVRDLLPAEAAAVRYGADEILLVMPGAAAAGASSLVERLRRRLGGAAGVHAVIGSAGPGSAGPADLLRGVEAALPRRAGGRG